MENANVAENYLLVCKEIAKAALACGREFSGITVIAVSKFKPVASMKAVQQAGCCDFGESRIQEALDKMLELDAKSNWHLIGSLQKNKVRKVIGKFSLIHSVDSFELAKKISEMGSEMDVTTSILLQVNTSGEVSKHGFSTEMCWEAFPKILDLPHLSVEGFMTMAPLTDDEGVIRSCFRQLRLLRDDLQLLCGTRASLKHLSMGMSHDWKIAVEEGATLLRIGTSIFG